MLTVKCRAGNTNSQGASANQKSQAATTTRVPHLNSVGGNDADPNRLDSTPCVAERGGGTYLHVWPQALASWVLTVLPEWMSPSLIAALATSILFSSYAVFMLFPFYHLALKHVGAIDTDTEFHFKHYEYLEVPPPLYAYAAGAHRHTLPATITDAHVCSQRQPSHIWC